MIVLENLPFSEGKRVEVIALETTESEKDNSELYPLRGTDYKYDDPFGPAAPHDYREF